MTESRRDRFIRLLKSKSDLDIIEFTHDAVRELIEVLEEPERKTGRWLPVDEQPYFRKHFHRVYCSRCQKEGRETWDYCPNCGCRMTEVEHETD